MVNAVLLLKGRVGKGEGVVVVGKKVHVCIFIKSDRFLAAYFSPFRQSNVRLIFADSLGIFITFNRGFNQKAFHDCRTLPGSRVHVAIGWLPHKSKSNQSSESVLASSCCVEGGVSCGIKQQGSLF